MDDYISRQDASNWLKQYGQDVLHGKYKFSLMYIWKNIMNLPSADVAPVVHGEWIRSGLEGHIICNKCGYEAKHTIVERQDATGKWVSRFAQDMKTNFCPNCGTKMDAQGEE